MTVVRVAVTLLAVFVVLVLLFPVVGRSLNGPFGWFEVYVLVFYAAIIAAVVWLIRWMVHLGSDVAGIRRALEERNAQSPPVPDEGVPTTTPPAEPPGQ